MKRYVDEQVRITFEDFEARGWCLYAFSDTARVELETRLAAGELISPMPRLYARPEHWETLNPLEKELEKMRALSRFHGDWWYTGVSAAIAYGLSVSYSAIGKIEVASPHGAKTYNKGTVISRHIDIDAEVGSIASGLPVLPINRVLLDCARELRFRDAVAIVDSALRLGLTTKDELVAYFEAKKGYRYIRRAREVAAFADPRAESGGESIARAAMWELGFSAPDLQVQFIDPVDRRPYFVDFCWHLPDGRVIVGELDGGEKYVNPAMTGGRSSEEVRRAERLRESRLTACCSAIVRFSPQMVADNYRFNRLLLSFGIPKDHDPVIFARQNGI